jgi:hypothetical protein
LSHEDLAEMIGSSRPMVSKLIGDMIQEGLIARGGKRRFILRLGQRTLPLTSDDIQSPVQWNGNSKPGVIALNHTNARSSLESPYRKAARTVQRLN